MNRPLFATLCAAAIFTIVPAARGEALTTEHQTTTIVSTVAPTTTTDSSTTVAPTTTLPHRTTPDGKTTTPRQNPDPKQVVTPAPSTTALPAPTTVAPSIGEALTLTPRATHQVSRTLPVTGKATGSEIGLAVAFILTGAGLVAVRRNRSATA